MLLAFQTEQFINFRLSVIIVARVLGGIEKSHPLGIYRTWLSYF